MSAGHIGTAARGRARNGGALLTAVGLIGTLLALPTALGSPTAIAAPTTTGTISGTGYAAANPSGVFRDFDADGVWDVGEPGQAGITVASTCVADDGADPNGFDDIYGLPTTTTTAADGSFLLTGGNVRGLCRVEFSIPANLQTFLQPGAATIAVAAPNSAGSFVQFVDARLNPTVTTAVNNPADYTNPTSTPRVAVGRQDTGDPANVLNAIHAAAFPTIYTTEYSGTTLTDAADADETGSTWGLAYQPSTGTIFTSSLLKRHSGMGPDGPDAIYAIGTSSPWATPFTTVDTDGGAIGTNAARELTTFNSPSADAPTFAQVGKLSWGDLDISEDGTTLYAVNLLDKKIYPIDIATKTAGSALAIPDPGCTNGTFRPWALDVNDGLIYVGVVCDAGSGTAANLAAFVYAYNPTSFTLPLGGVPTGLTPSTWSSNLIDDTNVAAGIQLNYTKGCAVVSSSTGCGWNPWTDTYSSGTYGSGFPTSRPQPILADIEIDDDGSLLLGFIDRAGLQLGYRNALPTAGNSSTSLEGVSAGDILRAGVPAAAATSTFTLENNGSVPYGERLGGGTLVGGGVGDSQGPGSPSGEVYDKDRFQNGAGGPVGTNAGALHAETSLGALAKAAGKSEFLLGIMDPLDTDSGGIGWFASNGSARNDAMEIYDTTGQNAAGFGKGNGLGDIELLNDLAPVEIGNRVWRDDNDNGIQDPGEPPIAGVTVSITIGTGGTFTAVTDANGQYLFSSVARAGATTVPLLAASNYRLDNPDETAVITIFNATGGSQQGALAGMVPAKVNSTFAANPNAVDSDGQVSGTSVSVTITLGSLNPGTDTNRLTGDSVDREGYNRHIFDFGFVPRVSIGNRVWFDTDNSSTLDIGEQPVAGVAVQLFYDANANGVIDVGEQTPVAYDTTDANGLYFFDQFTDTLGAPLGTPVVLVPGNYVVGIAPSNFATGAVLDNYFSSGTTMGGAGVLTETAAPDVDATPSNTDDNGTTQTSGFYSGGVLSLPVTLTPVSEPVAEESGILNNNDNIAIPDNSSNLTVDFGFYTQSFGNLVWLDNGVGGGNDDNGLVDGAEAGIPGVTVQLFASNGTTQINVGADGILGTADDGPGGVVTNASGVYQFGGLPEGSYVVKIVAPAGYQSSTDPVAATTPFTVDSDDNGIGTGAGVISSSVFLLDPGPANPGNVVNNAAGTTTNPRVDFGLVQSYDLTIVKTVTSSGPYLANATVAYSLVASNNGPGVALDGLTVTDRLPAGLTYASPATTVGSQWTCAAPVGAEVTCTWVGPNIGLGNDTLASGGSLPAITINATVDDPAPNGVLVNFAVVEPSPDQSIPETNPLGSNPDKYEDGNPATGSNNDDSKPISSVPVVSVGDLVWIDADRDGQFDPTEAPIAGVIVTLLDGTGNPATDAFNQPVPPTMTDINGRYEFDNLLAGGYRVQFTLPAGYVWTAPNTGNDGLDSDAVPATQSSPTASTVTFTVTPSPVNDADTSPFARPVTEPTIDAGIVPIVSLGDLAWIDADHNGQFDSTEVPIAGMTVTLLDGTGNPAVDVFGDPVAPVQTDANGRYQFDDLAVGDYRVQFTLPAGYVWTTPNSGNDGLDSDAVPVTPSSPTATTGIITLTTSVVTDTDTNPNARIVTNPTIDAGVVPVLAVGDYVWNDLDHDGTQDAGEPPVAGVTVTLLNPDLTPALDANGQPVPPAVTDANGHYVFDNLPPGDYVISFTTIPAGFELTTQGAGGGVDSNPGPNGLTPVFTLSPSAADVTPVVNSDGVVIALLINRTIDAGIWMIVIETQPPTATTLPSVETLPTLAPLPPTTPTAPPITTTPQPVQLPATGSDSGWMLAAGLGAIAVGLLLTVRRRRSPA